jgi:alginate O-acetyltransferase complex protein AlgI
MLFNSYEFIFVFLPVVLCGFYIAGVLSRTWALRWLILASLTFYAWWRLLNVLLIGPSILINFFLARAMQNLQGDRRRAATMKTLLVIGIAFNVAFLGYFKYKNFFLGSVNDVLGTTFVLTHVVLPLGISFITFQKIAFLIDVHAGRIGSFTFQDYCLFVLFFPQLIAGPIVHFREMMPQFRATRCRPDAGDVSIGLTLLAFGMFKKVVLADGIAPLVSATYDRAAEGAVISLLPAWMAAVGFTLQIYFDFSGYSDMAIGLGRLFGIRLPPNFDSPLRATSIIDYWLRWHMTLTRFLTAYIYNPLVLAITRSQLKRGRSPLGGKNTTAGAFGLALVFPTMLTMLISGLWHGAGYLFILWGALHGVYLSINHAWRFFGPKSWKETRAYAHIMNPLGFVMTFTGVAAAMVFFRSATMKAAANIISGMAGLNGVNVPSIIYGHLGPVAAWLQGRGIGVEPLWGARDFLSMTVWTALLLSIALLFPNTLQMLARFEPALGVKGPSGGEDSVTPLTQWSASPAWALVIAIITGITILRLAGPSEFLYWQF